MPKRDGPILPPRRAGEAILPIAWPFRRSPWEGADIADVDIRLDRVTKRFADLVAVDDLSLEIQRGEFFSLLGPSGCGKTTTLRMVAGFEEASAGTIYLGGTDVTTLPAYRRDVNTVFQNYALFPHLNVFENVAFGPRRQRVRDADVRHRVGEMLELVQLAGYERRKPSQMSGGQQQRVALARALINRPRVLLLDEPLGALDLKLRKQMQLELKRIQTEVGITFVYVTHDQDEAMTMSDRIGVMNAGRLEQLGGPEELYERPVTAFVAGFLGVSNLLDGHVASRAEGMARIALDVGAEVRVPAAGLNDGARVRVGVRPEKLRLVATSGEVRDAPAGPGGDVNCLQGRVLDASYVGVSTQYVVRVGDATDVMVYAQNLDIAGVGQQLAPGHAVQLTWRPAHTFVIPNSEPPARGGGTDG